jgi:hypothetical protein
MKGHVIWPLAALQDPISRLPGQVNQHGFIGCISKQTHRNQVLMSEGAGLTGP